jgi:endonuclease YncB( thermonuclease family)
MALPMLILRSLCLVLVPVAFALAVGSSPSVAARSWPAPVSLNETFAGTARVLDGDTIHVGDTRVRLDGIDAPETAQSCKTAAGVDWACGHAATRALQLMADGRQVTCRNLGLEKYGRTLGTCFVDGRNINAEMVKLGLAWAFVRYSAVYAAEEAQARAAKIGIWQGAAQPAWDYRAQAWTAHAEEAPNGCAIKGNVTASGYIYHMPWSPWYNRVRINGHAGKRWFCTEADAMAAGWRPAYARRLAHNSEPTSSAAQRADSALEE